MSYRVGTPNYNLPQTEGSDKRDWTDTNQAFLVVDTALKTASDNASSAGSAASAAQNSADAAMTAATNAQTAAGNAQTAASTAGELAQTAKNRADSAYTLAGTANTKATALENVLKYQGSQASTEVISASGGQTKTYTVAADGWFQANLHTVGTSTNAIVWVNNIVLFGQQHISGDTYYGFYAKTGDVIKVSCTGAASTDATCYIYKQ